MCIKPHYDGAVSDVPEWSTMGVNDICSFGTFDASGAFMSKDVSMLLCMFAVIIMLSAC